MNAEIGELPVDILDRGSDGSETEPAGQSEAARPIALDNSDNSDHDVDVENVEESGSLLGSDDDYKGPMTQADTNANQREAATLDGPTGENDVATMRNLVCKRHSEVLSSDSHLLAAILNDLKGIAAPKCDHPLNFGPNCSSDNRKKRFRDQCEVSQSHSGLDDWSAQTRHPNPDLPEERRSNDIKDQNQGFDLSTCRTSNPPLPPLERLKECRVREEGRDVPPLLKQASPVRSYNRNTPPPLKHKDAGSPHLLPTSPIDLHSPHASVDAEPVCVNSHVDLNSNPTISPIDSHLGAELPKDNQVIPPISALKRHFTRTLALRGELISSGSTSAFDMHSSSHLAPIDSHSTVSEVRALTIGTHSMSHKPPIDSHSSSESEKRPTSADCSPHLDFFHSSKLHSSRDSTKESSGPRSSPVDLHSVNSLSPTDFHSAKTGWSKEKPVHTDSTSRGCRNKTLNLNSCQIAPVDLHPSSNVSAEGPPTSSDVFSGANCNDTSPPVFVSSIHSRTWNPSSPIDSHSSSKRENLSERLSPSRVSSVPTTAPSGRLSPIYVHPRSPKSTVGLHTSITASDRLTNKASPLVKNEERLSHCRLPPIDLHCTSPVPPANIYSSSFVSTMVDHHLNHTALSSSTFQTSRRKCSSQSEPTVESHLKLLHPTDSDSKPHNHFDPSSNPQFPIDTCSKHNLPIDSQPAVDSHSENSLRDNHIMSSPRSVENHWNSNSSIDAHSDSQSPVDERSASSVWNTQTHSAT